MRQRQLGAGALLAILITTTSTASVPRPIEPVPQASFAAIPITPSPTPVPAIAETKTRPIATPPPREQTTRPRVVEKTPRPVKVDQVSGKRWGVKEGARAAKAYARARMSAAQFDCLEELWRRESGWRWNAVNRSGSGAYGIPQALPGSKMRSAGSDWRTNPITQTRWGLGYVSGRYGSACAAWAHFKAQGWY